MSSLPLICLSFGWSWLQFRRPKNDRLLIRFMKLFRARVSEPCIKRETQKGHAPYQPSYCGWNLWCTIGAFFSTGIAVASAFSLSHFLRLKRIFACHIFTGSPFPTRTFQSPCRDQNVKATPLWMCNVAAMKSHLDWKFSCNKAIWYLKPLGFEKRTGLQDVWHITCFF